MPDNGLAFLEEESLQLLLCKDPPSDGPSLIELLHSKLPQITLAEKPFRMAVRFDGETPLSKLEGVVASGSLRSGEEITAASTGRSTLVSEITGPEGVLGEASTGQYVTLTLKQPLDVVDGDIVFSGEEEPEIADQFAAHIIWLTDDEMLPERGYTIEFAACEATAQITDLVHVVDTDSDDPIAAKILKKQQIGYCKVALDKAVAFDAGIDNRATGTFRLIDRITKLVAGIGTIDFALRRASNIEWHEMKISKEVRAKANNQKPCVLWFTGFSGSGKSTIADRLEQKLHAIGKRTYLLDGDNVRHGLNKDLGFTDQDRVENIRRVAEVAKLMVDAGLVVVTSFISPFRYERQMARSLMEDGEFIEVFTDTPLEICEQRDPKGLYKKARAGELKNFTGIDSEYEAPRNAEIVLTSGDTDADTLADEIIAYLEKTN